MKIGWGRIGLEVVGAIVLGVLSFAAGWYIRENDGSGSSIAVVSTVAVALIALLGTYITARAQLGSRKYEYARNRLESIRNMFVDFFRLTQELVMLGLSFSWTPRWRSHKSLRSRRCALVCLLTVRGRCKTGWRLC